LRESYDFDVIKIAGKSFVFVLILGNGKVFMDEWGEVVGGWMEGCWNRLRKNMEKKLEILVFFDLQS
jgi:hypothetical protein